MEGALQQGAFQSFLRAELKIEMDVGRSCHREEGADAHFPAVDRIAAGHVDYVMFMVLASLWRWRFAFPPGALEALSTACNRDFIAELSDCAGRDEWPATFIHELIPLHELRSLKSTSTTQCRVVGTKGLSGMDRHTAIAQLGHALLPNGPVLQGQCKDDHLVRLWGV
jgi:hypothetical protein